MDSKTTQYSDSEIILKIIKGETALFEMLIRRNNPFLYKVGRSYNYSHEDTQDLMQETFIQAYIHLSKFENRSSFKTWIIKIMLHNCFHKQQKASFKNETHNEINEKATPMFSNTHSDTLKTVTNKELRTVIENALQQIPQDYRIVFSLREMNGLNVAETSALLNITESNVKARLNRSKTMLRKIVEQSYTPEDIYEFNLIYCDAIVDHVMEKIKQLS